MVDSSKEKPESSSAVDLLALKAERAGLFEELQKEKAVTRMEEARLAASFGERVGCGPSVMREIDAMYAEAKEAYRLARASLDARFAKTRDSRDAWVAAQLDGHVKDERSATSLRAAAAAIPTGFDDSLSGSLVRHADGLDDSRALAEATLALWFDDDDSERCQLPTTVRRALVHPDEDETMQRGIKIKVEHLQDPALRSRVHALVEAKKKAF